MARWDRAAEAFLAAAGDRAYNAREALAACRDAVIKPAWAEAYRLGCQKGASSAGPLTDPRRTGSPGRRIGLATAALQKLS